MSFIFGNFTPMRKGRSRGSNTPRTGNRGGKKLKSGLEIYCYDSLKAAGLDFGYEIDEFVLLPSAKYSGVYHKSTPKTKGLVDKTGRAVLPLRYTPDFVSHKHKFIIETKGYVRTQHTFPLRWKLFLHYLITNGMDDYMLFIPKNKRQVDRVIEIIKHEISRLEY